MNCQYCEKELPPRNGKGRPQKFCDDKCRRRFHDLKPCQNCGAPSWKKLCAKCFREKQQAIKQQEVAIFWNAILDLRQEGLLNQQIAKRTGRSILAVQSAMHRMRLAGVNVPASTYDYHEYMNRYIASRKAQRTIKS